MIKKIFSLFIVYLFIGSLININVKSQEEVPSEVTPNEIPKKGETPNENTNVIDWNNGKQIEEALKKDPAGTIKQNPDRAMYYIRNHPNLVLENKEIGNAYFSNLGTIEYNEDRILAQKFLSKNTKKNFDLSKGTLEIKDGKIIVKDIQRTDASVFIKKDKIFSVNEIAALTDVVAVESINGGLRFHFKKKSVDILEAKKIEEDKRDLLIDGYRLSIQDGSRELKVESDGSKIHVQCKEACEFQLYEYNIKLQPNGEFEQSNNFVKVKNAVVKSGANTVIGNAEFYDTGRGFDTTKPIILIGEESSLSIGNQKHRIMPSGLASSFEDFTKKLYASIDGNKEFLDQFIEQGKQNRIALCLQCNPLQRKGFENDLSKGKIDGYIFGDSNPISEKLTMINKGLVISNYDSIIILGTHKSTEFFSSINPANVIIDGPHSNEKNVILGSIITNYNKIDFSNDINGERKAKEDKKYRFGNAFDARIFFEETTFPEINLRLMKRIDDFIRKQGIDEKLSKNAVSRFAEIQAKGLIEGEIATGKLKISSEQKEEIVSAIKSYYEKTKNVADIDTGNLDNKKINNLYYFKTNGDLQLAQSGENHDLYTIIAHNMANDAFYSYLINNPKTLSSSDALNQVQRLYQYMAWKNIEVHKSLSNYEDLNSWGYLPRPSQGLYNYFLGTFTSSKQDELNKIAENDRAQEGAQILLNWISSGYTIGQLQEKLSPDTYSKVETVLNDPGIKAWIQIEALKKQEPDPERRAELLLSETPHILKNAVDDFKKQNQPEQAMIFQAEYIKAKFGLQGEEVLKKILGNGVDLCDTSTGCGGLFTNLNSKDAYQLDSIKNRFVINGVIVQYQKDLNPELVQAIKDLYDFDLERKQDKNWEKFKEVVSEFFTPEQIAIGLFISVASGNAQAIYGKISKLAKEYISNEELRKVVQGTATTVAISVDATIGLPVSEEGKAAGNLAGLLKTPEEVSAAKAGKTLEDLSGATKTIEKIANIEESELTKLAKQNLQKAIEKGTFKEEDIKSFLEWLPFEQRNRFAIDLADGTYDYKSLLAILESTESSPNTNIQVIRLLAEGLSNKNIELKDIPIFLSITKGQGIYFTRVVSNSIANGRYKISDLTTALEILDKAGYEYNNLYNFVDLVAKRTAEGGTAEEISKFASKLRNYGDINYGDISDISFEVAKGSLNAKDIEAVLDLGLARQNIIPLAKAVKEGEVTVDDLREVLRIVKTNYDFDLVIPFAKAMKDGSLSINEIKNIYGSLNELEIRLKIFIRESLDSGDFTVTQLVYSIDEIKALNKLNFVFIQQEVREDIIRRVVLGDYKAENIIKEFSGIDFIGGLNGIDIESKNNIIRKLVNGKYTSNEIIETFNSITTISGLSNEVRGGIFVNILENKYTLEDVKDVLNKFGRMRTEIGDLIRDSDNYHALRRRIDAIGPEAIEKQYYEFREENRFSLKSEGIKLDFYDEAKAVKPTLESKIQNEIDAMVRESGYTLEYIEDVRKQADKIGKEVVVVCNPSYGFLACAPIVEELQRRGIKVWFNRVGSSEAHGNENILAASGLEDLFSNTQREFLSNRNPVVVVIDGTTSFNGDITRTGSHLPDSHKGFRNQIALIEYESMLKRGYSHSDALEQISARFEFPGGVSSLDALITSPEAQQIIKKIKQTEIGNGGYKIGQWNPDGLASKPRVSKVVYEEDKAYPVINPNQIEGPGIIFVQPTSLQRLKKEFPALKDHTAAFFDDSIEVRPTLTENGFSLEVFCVEACGPGKINLGRVSKQRAKELGIIN